MSFGPVAKPTPPVSDNRFLNDANPFSAANHVFTKASFTDADTWTGGVAGVGMLKAGTPVAFDTGTGRCVAYDDEGVGDAAVLYGFIKENAPGEAATNPCAVVVAGTINVDFLPVEFDAEAAGFTRFIFFVSGAPVPLPVITTGSGSGSGGGSGA